jgi:hypothetical protein
MRWLSGALLLALLTGRAQASCPELTEAHVYLSFSGAVSGCSRAHPYCVSGETVTFKVLSFGVSSGCSASWSYQWSFDGGATIGGQEVVRPITGTTHVAVNVRAGERDVQLAESIYVIVYDRWPMIVERLVLAGRTLPNAFRFSTMWPGDIVWDFGDGTLATGTVAEHHYEDAPGQYTVTVRSSTEGTISRQIRVLAVRRCSARH